MTLGAAIATCWTKYATFDGRAVRSELWWFVLFCALVNLALSATLPVLAPLAALALLLPNLAVNVRRLHDVNRTGWWLLLILVPPIGLLVLLYWFVQPGTVGANDYGPDPLDRFDAGPPAGTPPVREVRTGIPGVKRR